jgi:hypothetical protein
MITTLKTEITVAAICEGFVSYQSVGNNLEEVILS